ncbi:sugar lactone lactonase YvrE [Maribacter vaceletii]|uniref:Sugar lactone lactonase YvrE n=1 Tax=Maribacter vaceletii TaxID=1206816 RepID=A0A495E664_9FLAO|nr:SMP-30/gluconolactonase/LRE family protein [Maribacter vaceletii]RKR12191.1 sugar lactone lactonase YvrE [Maribacter vaceletii]
MLLKKLKQLKKTIPIIGMVFFISCNEQKKKENYSITSELDTLPKLIIAKAPGQNPEGIEYDKKRKLFFLSSINKNPAIITLDFKGNVKVFSDEKEKKQGESFGLQIDYKNNYLLACANYLESSSHIAIYNLTSGLLKHTINLSEILPEKKLFQANDLIVDDNDIIYVTGRLENTIYKIDTNLKPSILYQKEGLGLPNGIIYNPKGYLLVSYYTKEEANLIKIPINTPTKAEIIQIKGFDFRGFDGMILNEKGNLVGVAKNFDNPKRGFVFELSTEDEWKTAKVVQKISINRSSTIAQVNSEIYYVLNQDWKNKNAKTWTLEKVSLK